MLATNTRTASFAPFPVTALRWQIRLMETAAFVGPHEGIRPTMLAALADELWVPQSVDSAHDLLSELYERADHITDGAAPLIAEWLDGLRQCDLTTQLTAARHAREVRKYMAIRKEQ